MANRFLNNIKINDSYTLPSADGTANQIIQTNGAGELSFIDPSAISVGESEQVHIACKNTSGVAISKGDPVYITGTVGTSFIIQIAKADASNSAKMPAVGLAETDLGLNAEGFVIVSGVLKNLTTDPLSTSDGTPSSNDTVYVKAGGGLTKTKPTGSGNLIQNVGKVGRVNSANAGSLAVSTIMRTNDVPNLTTGKIWVGSPTYTTESTVVHLDETNGRMGIGTTSPGYKLDVNGGAQFNTNTGATPFYITRLGNIDQALSIKVMDDNVRFESIQDESADSYGGFDFRMDGGVTEPNFVIRKNADDPILHVDGAGKVGINSTNPLSTLQVGDGTADSSFRTYYSDSTYAEVKGYGVNFNRQYSYLRPTTDNYAFLYIGSQPNTWNELHLHSNKITFSDNTSEVMRINPGGNVGIGTTSPGQKLTIDQGVGNVNQGIPATSGSTQNGILRLQPGGPYGESFDFGMNVSTTYAWIQPTNKVNHSVNYNLSLNPNGGNVGIGTTSPSYTLDVSGSAGSTARFKGSGGQATVSINDGTNDNYIVAVSGEFQLRPSGTTVLTTKSSGNVGIGTTSPDSKLTINGGVNSVWAYSTTTSDQPGFIAADNADYASHTNLLYNKIYGSGITATSFGQTLGNWAVVASSGTSNNGLLVGTFSNKPVIIGTNSAARMTITNSGNVGIGTTSPDSKLTVFGDIMLKNPNGSNPTDAGSFIFNETGTIWGTNIYGFRFNLNGSSNILTLQSANLTTVNDVISFTRDTANVGIGTTSPSQKLDVIGDDVSGPSITWKQTNRRSGYLYSDTAGVGIYDTALNNAGIYLSSNSRMDFRVNGSERMRIDSSGNVGIGTTSPSNTLHVSAPAGSARVTSTAGGANLFLESTTGNLSRVRWNGLDNFAIRDDADSQDRLVIDTSGNVGIGTTSPVSIGGHSGILTLYGSNATALALKDSVSEGHLRFNDYNFKFTNTGGDVRMQIEADTGNVGIGTTSPAHKLTINASNNTTALGIDFPSAHFDFSANSTSGYTSNFRINDVGMDIGHDSTARSLNLQTGNQDRLTILGTGNVGIGTTSPNSNVEIKEDVNNGEGAELRVINDGTAVGTGQTTTITIGRNFEERNIKIKSVSSEDYGRKPELVITQNQNESGSSHVEVLRIDSSGNVGIGEDEPATKLDVSGNIRMTETAATSDTDKFVVLDSGVLKYRNGAEIRDDIDAIGGSGTGGTIALFTASGTDLGDSIITQSSQPDKITIGGQLSLQGSGDVLNISHYSGSVWFIDTSTGDDILFGAPATNTQNVGVQGDLYAYNGDLGTKSFGSFNNKISRTGNSYFNAGNVGIGTTSPSQKLTINGTDQYVATQHTSFPWDGSVTIGLKMGTDNAAGLLDFRRWTGSATLHGTALITQVSSDGGYGLDFRVDNKSTNTSATTSRMFLSTSGEVGIGTISPAAKLEVNGTSLLRGLVNITTSGEMLRLNDTNSSGNPYMSFYQNGTRRSFIQHADTGDFLKLASEYGGISFFTGTGGTETQKVTIQSGGNVGIGTTSPGAKLDVSGGDIRLSTNATYLRSKDSASAAPRVLGMNSANTFYIGPIDSYAGGGIIYGASSNVTYHGFWGGGGEKVRITSGGNVGIGTTSPSAMLHVSGSQDFVLIESTANSDATYRSKTTLGYYGSGTGIGSATNCWNVYDFNAGSERMRINSSGYVGIGTTDPAFLLDVNEDDNVVAFRVTGGGGGSAMASFVRDVGATGSQININAQNNFPQIQFVNTGNTFAIGGDTSGNFKISDNAAIGTNDRITIDNTGNVGIGTDDPGAKLQINNATTVGSTSSNLSGLNPILYLDAGQAAGRSIVLKNHTSGDNTVVGALRFAASPDGSNYSHASIEAKQDGNAAVDTLEFRTSSSNTQGAANNLAMIIEGTDVGIGTTSPSIKLDVVDASASRTWSHYFATVAAFERNGDSIVNIVSGNTGNASLWFGRSNSMVRGRIRYEQGNDKMELWTANAPKAYIDSSGNLHATADVVAYSSSVSDIRLKDNINTIDSALNKVKKLRGVEYTWNAGSRKDKKDLGVIAQEVEEVLPEIVHEHKMDLIDEQVYKTVDYEKITAVLIEAVKEQQKQIDELKNQLDAFTK